MMRGNAAEAAVGPADPTGRPEEGRRGPGRGSEGRDRQAEAGAEEALRRVRKEVSRLKSWYRRNREYLHEASHGDVTTVLGAIERAACISEYRGKHGRTASRH